MLTVEQCQCPMGYRGLSCQYCDIGFTRISSYNPLSACVLCFCNGHSSDCDPNTGVCKVCLKIFVFETLINFFNAFVTCLELSS